MEYELKLCLKTFVGVPPMVQDAKAVAVNPSDHNAVSRWRESNKAVSFWSQATQSLDVLIPHFFLSKLLNAVGQVRNAVHVSPEHPPLPDFNTLNLGKSPFRSFSQNHVVNIHINMKKLIFYANLVVLLITIQISFSEPTANTYFVDKGTILGLLEIITVKEEVKGKIFG